MTGASTGSMPAAENFLNGDRVEVMKESRFKGSFGIVLDSNWHGLIKIEIEGEEENEKIKSYRACELRLADKTGSGETLSPSDRAARQANLSLPISASSPQ